MRRVIKLLVFAFWLSCMLLPAGDKDTLAASQECLDCHEDVDEVLSPTVHNQKMKVSCIDCHGVTEEHLDDPDVGNIDNGKGSAAMDRCLSCHESEIHSKRPRTDMHAAAEVNCADCHEIHNMDQRPRHPLLEKPQLELCLSCHEDVGTQLAKPYTHKVANGVMSCTSCHDPHGGRGQKRFTHGDMETTCASCHVGKRGPFVFSHVTGIAGDCMSCHEPHGSSNPRQLSRASVNQVCLECHSTLPAGNFGSQPPSTHNLRTSRYQDCVACHTAVHGSSRSPVLLK